VYARGTFFFVFASCPSFTCSLARCWISFVHLLPSSHTFFKIQPASVLFKTQVAEHTTAVVGELKSSLVRVTKTFKSVVQQRSANVKAQEERKKECVERTTEVHTYRPVGKPFSTISLLLHFPSFSSFASLRFEIRVHSWFVVRIILVVSIIVRFVPLHLTKKTILSQVWPPSGGFQTSTRKAEGVPVSGRCTLQGRWQRWRRRWWWRQ